MKDNEWPVSPASSEEPGLPSGQPSHGQERAVSPILTSMLIDLAQSMMVHTEAINRLIQINQDLIRAMAEDSGMGGDDEPKGYLNARTL